MAANVTENGPVSKSAAESSAKGHEGYEEKTISKPVQPAKGSSSYAGAAEKGIPAILAEAGGVGQMQEDQVELLVNGVKRVMKHLGIVEAGDRGPKTEDRKEKSKVLTKFEWVYTKQAGMWYPKVAAGDAVNKGIEIGRVGDLFGDVLEKITSPVDGVVLFLTINPSVLENGLLMGIGCGG